MTFHSFRSTKDEVARAAFPQAKFGHVGISFGKSKKIIGFGPRLKPGEKVAFGKSFKGKLTNDTAIFNGLEELGVSVNQHVVQLTRGQYYKARFRLAIDRGLSSLGLLRKRYAFPRKVAPHFDADCFNCATYPVSLGFETPFPSGILSQYLK